MRAIGCFEAVKKNGIDTTGIEILNAKGKRLALADQSDHERVFGAPSITIRRGMLAEILLAQPRATGVDARFNVRMTGVAASSDRVRLALSDGASHDADILVAADGLRSSVREMVFPEYPRPHYTGLIGTGGITEAEISDTGGLMRMTFGSNAFFGYLKPAGQPGYWFDSYAADESDIEKINNPTGYARDELVDAGRHALRGWKLRSENRRQLGHSCTRNSSLKSLPTSGHATRTSHSAESHLMPHSLVFSLAALSSRSPKR